MSQWVIMDQTQRFIVKGRAEKCLLALDEPTKKETVYYKTGTAAKNAIRSSVIYLSEQSSQQYGLDTFKHQLLPVEIGAETPLG